MGIAPSKTELFLPSDTIRLCSPDRCWCNGRHNNRASKYVYVERGGDGRERYQDPVDMMGDFLMGGGGGAAMPWRSPGEWTVRDYERLGEVLNEWQMRERGRRRNPSFGSPMMGGGGNIYGPSPWEGGGGGGGRSRRTHPSWGEFERMQETVEDKFRRMAEEYQRHLAERDSLLFGSSSDHRKEQYRNNMLKTLQEILPQLSQMMAAQQFGGAGGMNAGMGMGMPNGMQGGMPMGGVAGPPFMGMQNGGVGMQGMNMNPMMNPMAAAASMGGGAGMGPMHNPMMAGGGVNDMGGGGGGGGFGRRARGRRERPFREDFDEDFGGFGVGRAGRPFRRGRRGGWGEDDDDMLGGFGGDVSPRRPQGGPRPPRRPDGGDFGDGGVAHEHGAFGQDVEEHFRPAPAAPQQHAQFQSQPGFARPLGTGFAQNERTNMPDRATQPMVPPMRGPSPPEGVFPGPLEHTQARTPAMSLPMNPDVGTASRLDARYRPTGVATMRQTYNPTGSTNHMSGAACETGTSATRPEATARDAGFRPEARLSRPRDEETDRKEPEAGAIPTKRDLQ